VTNLERPFLATTKAIIDVEQEKIVTKSKEDFLAYKVSMQIKYLSDHVEYE